MFACLYSLSTPLAALLKVAEDFTPRFEVIGPMVMLDITGLTRLFGGPREIGEELRRTAGAAVRVSLAPSQTAAALLALGRPGLTVVLPDGLAAALAGLPVGLLGELERIKQDGHVRHTHEQATEARKHGTSERSNLANQDDVSQKIPCFSASVARPSLTPPHVAGMVDVLPYFESCLDRTTEITRTTHACGGGWSHPRDSHAAGHMRRARRAPQAAGVEHAHVAGAPHPAAGARPSVLETHQAARNRGPEGPRSIREASGPGHAARRTVHAALKESQALLDTLRRWGITTLGALAALPPGEVYERLGGRGVMWQRLARGGDPGPLVPWVLEEPFEAVLDLEWPIEGLEPLSFVLARLFEPLAERLERADRGAAILHTHLHLVSRPSTGSGLREIHARTVQLPAPMRDPKTLRTLVLLDLESNPPSAAIDRVRVLVEPTPARVLQWALFERAQPSPEQVSTLLARLLALMGEGHVGSPQVIDSWKPGAFEMHPFRLSATQGGLARDTSASFGEASVPATALRRFRFPVPARVQVQEGRPVRVMVDRRGLTGGAVRQAAGPWRTSGEWWNDGQVGQACLAEARGASHASEGGLARHTSASFGEASLTRDWERAPARPRRSGPSISAAEAGPTHPPCTAWDRDEWDVALGDGTLYRIFVEREVGQWFIEGVVD